jgi:hypothetical protein
MRTTHSVSRFLVDVLGWRRPTTPATARASAGDHAGSRIRLLPADQQKPPQNENHLDLTSTSLADQQQTVARALRFGARHTDVGQHPEDSHVVLADPEGNEFCVIGPGNKFLADCGFVGALACDGSQQVGYFWSEALGWPLVWDQDQETAIRSPHGGPKISWGGQLPPKTGKSRLHFDLAPPPTAISKQRVNRLIPLGATRIDIGQGDVSWVVMAGPDGHEFCVMSPR